MATFDKWVSDARPDMPVGKVTRQALELRLGSVLHYFPLAAYLAEENIEYVHAARVSTRRASAALNLFRGLVPPRHRKKMKQTLRTIRTSMGDARDLDVYITRFSKTSEPGTAVFLQRLERQRREAQATIVEWATSLLANERLRRQVGKLIKKTKKHAKKSIRKQPFGTWAVEQLLDEWNEFVAAVPESDPAANELHQFRIATKRFRYAVELLNNGLPGSVREVLYPQVKQLQSQLGEIQDHAVAAEKLSGWKKQATDPAEVAMLAQFEQDERDQYIGKSEAFIHWWRRDRIDELYDAVESLRQSPNEATAS
jgi:CHAD domain-containing protein